MYAKCAVVPDKKPKENKKENKMEAASGQDVACNSYCSHGVVHLLHGVRPIK